MEFKFYRDKITDTISGETMLRLHQVEFRTDLSRSKVYELMREDRFPSNHKIGVRQVAWRESDVMKWIEERDKRGFG